MGRKVQLIEHGVTGAVGTTTTVTPIDKPCE